MNLPHTYPILLVDSHAISPSGEMVKAEYTIPMDHPVMEGHFPHIKIWPGVYMIEGMNQTAGLHALNTAKEQFGDVDLSKIVTFVTSIDKVKFRQPVFPGDKLTYTAELIAKKRSHLFYECVTYRDAVRVSQATIGLTAKEL
jgi:3-hydroxyacyl-[acyl-carrier-protein] dehydratase|tara:strand:+ start:141 stop:566 length:426 start_codon:yes stop_codon:yes gene_type:complete